MPADLLSKTPRNVSDDQAAGVALTSIAAVVAFYDKSGRGLPAPWAAGGKKAGEGKAIVILGGATSVRQYAIQWARISGYGRIVTTASPKHGQYLKSLGAHDVLDRRTVRPGNFVEALRGLPLDFVLDGPSVRETQVLGIEVVRAAKAHGGYVITLYMVDDDVKELAERADLKVPTTLS